VIEKAWRRRLPSLGSVPLLGVDKVTKYHMDARSHRHVPVVDESRTYAAMSAAQKKVIDDTAPPNGPANSRRGRISSTRASRK